MPSAVSDPETSREKSISAVVNVEVVNDATIINQNDSVRLSFELFIRLFPLSNSNPNNIIEGKYILVKLLGSPDKFQEFKIYKVSAIDHNAHDNNSIIFVNHSDLAKYKGRITLSNAIVQSIDKLRIPKLENLYISVPPNIYQVLHSKPTFAVRQRFIENYLEHNGGVASSGSSVRVINGEIKLCEPTSQGLIDNNTNIVLIKNPEEQFGHNGTSIDSEEEYDLEQEEDLDLSAYLSSSMHITSEPTRGHNFQVSPLREKIIPHGLRPHLFKEDSELYVFINVSDLIKLGFPVFSGDTVKFDYGNDKIFVKVFTFLEPNDTYETGKVYLSPSLILNLGLDGNSKIVFEPAKENKPFTSLVPTAKAVTIARVASPITMDKTYQQHFFSELKTTFNNQFKCVKKGGLIPVVIDTVLAKTIFDTTASLQQQRQLQSDDDPTSDSNVIPSGDPDSVAWFKITEAIYDEENDNATQQFIIDPLKTRLISTGVEFMRLPENEFSRWHEYLRLPSIFDYGTAIKTNPSTFTYAAELKKIISTCLNSKINRNLMTTVLLNSMSRGLGKSNLVRSLSIEMGLNLIELDCFDLINPGAELKTIGILKGKIDKLISSQEITSVKTEKPPFHVIYLRHIESLCAQSNQNEQGANITTSLSLRVIQALKEYLEDYSNLMIIVSCNDLEKLNENFRLTIKFQIDFNVPEENERSEIFKYLIQNEVKKASDVEVPAYFGDREEFQGRFEIGNVQFSKRPDVTYQALALQSAGLTPRDLISIVKEAKNLAICRLKALSKSTNLSFEEIIKVGNGGLVTWVPEDFNKAINEARNQFSDSIGAPRIPDVKWEDVGGLDLVKDQILDTIDMPLKHPELFSNGLKKRSGILFYGPPGTGKTLLAKAIATNFSLNFFSVKGPELLNMYIGESEANVRRVFQKARDAKPCVIFFDELDSVAPKRGNQGDSGGVMDRIVSQLLAELDGMSGGGNSTGGVFVVGATNRPDLLDEALLRPGRFDKMVYLGISDTNEKQAKILEALTRKFKLDDDVDLNKIAAKCSFTFTGADFYALCSDSMLNAMTRIANQVDAKIKKFNDELETQGKPQISTRWWFDNVATAEDVNVVVKMEDFDKAQSELVPSVSAEELQHYLRVRENFEGGKEKAMNRNGDDQGQKLIPPDLMNKIKDLVDEDIVDASYQDLQNGTLANQNNPNNQNNGH